MRAIALERSKCLNSSHRADLFCARWLSPWDTTSFVFAMVNCCFLYTRFKLSHRHMVVVFENLIANFHVFPVAFRCAANKIVFARFPFRLSAMLDSL